MGERKPTMRRQHNGETTRRGDRRTVRAVRATALRLRAVAHRVLDEEVVRIQTLHLGVRLGVLQEVEHHASRLDGPSALRPRRVAQLALRVAADTAGELGERDSLFELKHVLEIALRLGQLHALDARRDLTAVLEVRAEARAARLGRLDGGVGLVRVLRHFPKTRRACFLRTTLTARQRESIVATEFCDVFGISAKTKHSP